MSGLFYTQLGERESQIMDVVYRLEEADAETIRKELPEERSNSTIRTMLRHLEEKGYLDHRKEGRAYVYYPVRSKDEVRRSAIAHLAEIFFDGSMREAALAFLSADDDLTPGDLDDLERRIQESGPEDAGSPGEAPSSQAGDDASGHTDPSDS